MNRKFQSFLDYFKKTDLVLWLLTLVTVIYSFLIISSMQRSGDYNFLKTQIAAVAIGFISAIIISHADYRYLVGKWYLWVIAAATLAILVFIFGIQVTGTDDTAWLSLPGGFTIQPSELIKICFIISHHINFIIAMVQKRYKYISLFLCKTVAG